MDNREELAPAVPIEDVAADAPAATLQAVDEQRASCLEEAPLTGATPQEAPLVLMLQVAQPKGYVAEDTMIYVSCPYTTKDAHERAKRERIALEYTVALARGGSLAFSPVTYGSAFPAGELNYAQWMRLDLHLLQFCTEMHVLCLPGWRESKGVQMEISVAKNHVPEIHIYYVYPDSTSWNDYILQEEPNDED